MKKAMIGILGASAVVLALAFTTPVNTVSKETTSYEQCDTTKKTCDKKNTSCTDKKNSSCCDKKQTSNTSVCPDGQKKTSCCDKKNDEKSPK